MSENPWFDILARISTHSPIDLDAHLPAFPEGPTTSKGNPSVRQDNDAGNLPPSSTLWPTRDVQQSYIGIRVKEPVADCAAIAIKLAAAAVERNVIPIILSQLDLSGFEQFGFRVERLPTVDHSTAEAELVSFWNLAIVIDAHDVTLLS